MAALDPVHPPHFDDASERKIHRPAEMLQTDTPTRLAGPAKGNIRTINDKILGAARDRYKKLVLRNMYPMGFDFVTSLPTKASGAVMKPQADMGMGPPPHHEAGGQGISSHAKILHDMKQKLWKKAVRHSVAKIEGKGVHDKKKLLIPERPRIRQLFEAQQRAAKGITARGLMPDEFSESNWEPHAYTTSGNGVLHITHEGAGMPSGCGTTGGFIQALLPLISMAGPLITEGINMISGIISNAIAKRRAKKAAEAQAAAAEEAARQAGVTPLTTGHGSIIPPPVGMPNPFTKAINTLHWRFPIPPPQWPIHPDPLSIFREIYNRARGVLSHTARASGLPDHKAIPIINKMLWRHAKSTFGHGFANEIMHTSNKLKPMPEINAWNLIAPFIHREKLSPVAHHILSTPHRGGSLGDILGALSGIFSNLGPEIAGSAKTGLSALASAASEYAPMWKESGKAGARTIIEALKSPGMKKFLATVIPGGTIGILSAIMKHIRDKAAKNRLTVPPEANPYLNLPDAPTHTPILDESSGDYEEQVRRRILKQRGKGITPLSKRTKKLFKAIRHQRLTPSQVYSLLHLTAGRGVWDILKTIGSYGLEFATPMLGSMASKALGQYDPVFEELGRKTSRDISRQFARQREREADEDFSQRRRRQALDDYERAAKISPEELALIRKKADAAKNLADVITSLEGGEAQRSIYSPDLMYGDIRRRQRPSKMVSDGLRGFEDDSDEEFWRKYRKAHKSKKASRKISTSSESSSSASEEKHKKHTKYHKQTDVREAPTLAAAAPAPPDPPVMEVKAVPIRYQASPNVRAPADFNSIDPHIERFRATAVATLAKKRAGRT
jgi:hypothetical protein